jgi:hypothetical protein
MMQFFPSYFTYVENNTGYIVGRVHTMTADGRQYVWSIVFLIEHLLFFGAAAVYTLVPTVPEWYTFIYTVYLLIVIYFTI